jgi:outer membrane receptor protein involved in Fe transport
MGAGPANAAAQGAPAQRVEVIGTSPLSGLGVDRNSRRDTVNGDGAEAFDPLQPDQNASLNTTATRQSAWGAALRLARRSGAHQWQVGASIDASRGVLAGDEAAEPSASVTGKSLHLGLYATDTWQLAPATHLTTTLRANRSRVGNTLTTVDDDTGVLEAKPDERFTYTSLSPAVGVTRQLRTGLAVFANLARNSRVPTVIELGCADPDEPCRLPVGLQSDPYLKPARATSLEASLRWRPVHAAWGQRLELSLFRTDNRDDILFDSVSATSQLGCFRNFQRSRHQGLDAAWPGHMLLHLRLQWQATPAVALVAQVQNALNERYATDGALAETVFDAQGGFTGQGADALFVAPGAPRSLWLGQRLKF